MAGKKDKAVVAIIKGLTDNQASLIAGEIMKSKRRHTTNSCGTAFICPEETIGRMIQKVNNKRIGGR